MLALDLAARRGWGRGKEATAAEFFRGGGGRLLSGGSFKFSRSGREHVSMWTTTGARAGGVHPSVAVARPFRALRSGKFAVCASRRVRAFSDRCPNGRLALTRH
jgi:hypothetical protein